jgi:hypothetical protein
VRLTAASNDVGASVHPRLDPRAAKAYPPPPQCATNTATAVEPSSSARQRARSAAWRPVAPPFSPNARMTVISERRRQSPSEGGTSSGEVTLSGGGGFRRHAGTQRTACGHKKVRPEPACSGRRVRGLAARKAPKNAGRRCGHHHGRCDHGHGCGGADGRRSGASSEPRHATPRPPRHSALLLGCL